MTVADVEKRLADLAACAGDPEIAHCFEDILVRDVLRAIAQGVGDAPRDLAAAVLKSSDIEFERWCA